MSMPDSVRPGHDDQIVNTFPYIQAIRRGVEWVDWNSGLHHAACARGFHAIYWAASDRLKGTFDAKLLQEEQTGKTYDEVSAWLKFCVTILERTDVEHELFREKALLRNIIHAAALLWKHHSHYLAEDSDGTGKSAGEICTICHPESTPPSLYETSGLPPPSFSYSQ